MVLINLDEPFPGLCFSAACSLRTFEKGISALNLTECIRRKTQLLSLRYLQTWMSHARDHAFPLPGE